MDEYWPMDLGVNPADLQLNASNHTASPTSDFRTHFHTSQANLLNPSIEPWSNTATLQGSFLPTALREKRSHTQSDELDVSSMLSFDQEDFQCNGTMGILGVQYDSTGRTRTQNLHFH